MILVYVYKLNIARFEINYDRKVSAVKGVFVYILGVLFLFCYSKILEIKSKQIKIGKVN